MLRSLFVLAPAAVALTASVGSASAATIAAGDVVAFDVQNGGNGTTTHDFAGLLASTGSTWNLINANGAHTSLVSSAGAAVDGLAVTNAPKTIPNSSAVGGGPWSGWGTTAVAGESNAVTQDYVHDSNTNKTDTNFNGTGTAHDAGSMITGLDPNLLYNIVVHANRIHNNDFMDGGSVTVGGTTIVLPSHAATNDGTGKALWPNGGFASGVTSAVFTGVAASPSGQINIFYDKAGGSPFILNGLEIQAVPEPGSVMLYGLGTLCLMRRHRKV